MRKITWLLLGLMVLSAKLNAADPLSVLKREAGKCALAWQREDSEAIISYLPAQVVAKSGGRSAMVGELKGQFKQARALGADRMEVATGVPSTPRQIATWLTSVIPVTAILHGLHLDLTQQTHVLAVSNDQGKHWFFVLLYQTTPAELKAWFPEFAGKIAIPADPAPDMEFVY